MRYVYKFLAGALYIMSIIPALVVIFDSIVLRAIPETNEIAFATAPITLCGWFVVARLNRNNAKKQAKFSEVNKTIDAIEVALKNLSEDCFNHMNSDGGNSSVDITLINAAKVARVNGMISRLKTIDSGQLDSNFDIINLRKLLTNDENFSSKEKSKETYVTMVNMENWITSKLYKRF